MKKFLLPLLAAALLPVAASADATPVKISEVARSFFYRDSKAWVGRAGFNGGDYSDSVFNGNFTDYRYQNTAGAYLVIDTTLHDSDGNATANGYYVTDIQVGHAGNAKYSLYYTTDAPPDFSGYQLKSVTNDDRTKSYYYEVSSDNRTWTPVGNGVDVTAAGTRTYTVNATVTGIKYVFVTSQGWNGTSLAEIEVHGIDPSELACQHPEEYLTEWESVPGTASCTEFGIDQCECTNCGAILHRESPTMFPLGHLYETVLVERGTSLEFGSGTNVCKRCGKEIDFSEPRDLALLGGFKAAGVINFTDVTISSFFPSWGGIPTTALLDNNWTWDWGKYWVASSLNHNDVYIDFEFAATIDLTSVDISVHNHAQVVEFYSLVGEEEILVGDLAVERDSSPDAPECQRLQTSFRGVSLSTLRVRFLDDVGVNTHGLTTISCSELHPWGTVEGAGKTAAVRTRIIID